MSADATRLLTLCADDYGLAPGISGAIRTLVRAGRLNAVSCLTNGRHWPAAARALDAPRSRVDVGLHLNFTEGRPLSAALARVWPRLPPLGRLIALAHLRRLPIAAIRAEVHAQLAAFRGERGAAPDFIDGHQHVHHLPGHAGSHWCGGTGEC